MKTNAKNQSGGSKSIPRRRCAKWQLSRIARIVGVAVLMVAAAKLSAKNLAWQSASDTAWENAANWYDTGAATTSATAPTGSDNVTIDNSQGATAQPGVTTAGQAAGTLVVGNGYTLTISGSTATLLVGDGLTGNNDITIQNGGTIINSGTSSSTSPFPFGVKSTANDKFRIDGGGTYVHNTSRSYTTPFPAGVQNFDANSTFIWRGSSSISPSVVFSSRTFGNLIIESTSGLCTPAANTGTMPVTVNGNFLVGATGAGTVSYTVSSATVTSPWSIAGNISVGSGSTLSFAAMPITLVGNLTNNGTLSLNSSATNFFFNGPATTVSGGGTTVFGGGFVINPGMSVSLLQSVAVTNKTTVVNGTLNCGTSVISGAGNFTLAPGAHLGIGDPAGITASGASGNIQVAGTRVFDPAANYTYNGSVAQAAGSGLQATLSSLAINNPAGLTLVSTESVTNLTLTAGVVGGNVVVVSGGSITGGGSGSYVAGTLQQSLTTSGTAATFPIGDGSAFAGVSLTGMTITANGTLALGTTAGQQPQINSSVINSSEDVNRYWTATAGGGLLVSTYDITLNFANGDVIGGATPGTFLMGKYDTGPGWSYPTVTLANANSTKASGITSGFSDFVLGNAQPMGLDHFTVTPSTSSTTAGTAFSATVQAYNASNIPITDNSLDGTVVTMTSSGIAQFDGASNGSFSDNSAALTNGTFTIGVRDFKAESITLTATSGSKMGTSSSVSIGATAAAQLQILLPGEIATPGTTTGKSGTPLAQTSGNAFSVIINEVDTNWNRVSSSDVMHLSATGDANAVLPADTALSGGTVTVTMTNILAGGGKTLTATDVSNGGISINTSSSYVVTPGPVVRLVILAPGETATLGTAPGKSGSPDGQHSTVGYSVTVDAMDASYNLATNSTDTVGMISSAAGDTLPANAALIGGTRTFSLTNNTVGSTTLTATNVTEGPAVLIGSSTVAVSINSTTISLISSANPANEGKPITLTATVSGAGTHTGTVTFKNGTAVLGTKTLSANNANLTLSGGAGTYSITAEYSGDASSSGSTSSALFQVIQPGAVVGSAALLEDGQDYAAAASTANPPVGRGPWLLAGGTGSTSFIKILAGELSGATSPDIRPLPNSVNPEALLQISRAGSASRWYYRSLSNNVSSGAIYFSFLLNVSVNPTLTDEFMGSLLATGVNHAPLATDPLTLHARAGSDGTHFNLGIQRLNGTTSWTGDMADNTTYLLVMKYTFGSAATCDLYVDPTPGSAEPAPSASASSDGVTAEPANIGTVEFYEGFSAPVTSGTYQYDVMRADNNWNTVTPSIGAASGSGATRLVFTPGGQTIPVNANSALITVTLLDQSNNTFTAASDTMVSLSSTSGGGTFLSSVDGTTVISSVTISSGSSTAGFYYKDSASGQPAITGASGLLTPASQTETVNPISVVLSGSQIQPNGNFQFQFSGSSGLGYSVWAGTNLTSWSIIDTGTFGNTPVTYTDTGATNYPTRFYRISIP